MFISPEQRRMGVTRGGPPLGVTPLKNAPANSSIARLVDKSIHPTTPLPVSVSALKHTLTPAHTLTPSSSAPLLSPRSPTPLTLKTLEVS